MAVLILGGAFALSATRDESPDSGPTTFAPTTTDVPARPEVLYRDDFYDPVGGVFGIELTEPGYQTLSIAFESSDPVPGLRIDAELTETAREGPLPRCPLRSSHARYHEERVRVRNRFRARNPSSF